MGEILRANPSSHPEPQHASSGINNKMGDNALQIEIGIIREGRRRPTSFRYHSSNSSVAELFDYLGVRKHWQEGPEAWEERDLKGTKALRAVGGSLRWVPHLKLSPL